MRTKNKAGEAMYGFIECTVRQFMTRSVVTVKRKTTMRELAALFEKHDFNAFPVLEEGKLVGMVSKFDFLRAFAFPPVKLYPITMN
jgi:CBS domain-containing protein